MTKTKKVNGYVGVGSWIRVAGVAFTVGRGKFTKSETPNDSFSY